MFKMYILTTYQNTCNVLVCPGFNNLRFKIRYDENITRLEVGTVSLLLKYMNSMNWR